MANDKKLLKDFESASAELERARVRFADAIKAIEKIDLFERAIRIVSACCGAFPYPNADKGKGKCDACGESCELEAMIF